MTQDDERTYILRIVSYHLVAEDEERTLAAVNEAGFKACCLAILIGDIPSTSRDPGVLEVGESSPTLLVVKTA